MQDFTKQNMTKLDVSKKTWTLTKKTSWLTKNRFWNLAFLIIVPLELYLAGITNNFALSFLLDVIAMFTAFWILAFSPKDLNTISKAEAKKSPYVSRAASFIVLNIIVCVILLILFEFKMFDIGLAPIIFFIFLIPVIILCYANIPLSHCFHGSKKSSRIRSIGSRICIGDSRTPYSIRSRNFKK